MRHLAALHAQLRGGAPAEEVLRAVCDRAGRALPAAAVLIFDASGRLRGGTGDGWPGLDEIVAGAVRTGRPVLRGPVSAVPLPGQAGIAGPPGVIAAVGRRRPVPPRRLEAFAGVAAVVLGTGEHQATRERERLARELHDSVVQTLYGISLGAGTAAELMHGDPANARASLAWIQETASAGLSDLRGIIVRLRPETLVGAGLATALRRIVDALHLAPGTGAVPPGWGLQLEAEPAVSPQVEEALYRIALEALGNAARHAGASQVTVRLAGDDTRVVLEVVDDGVGFQPGGPDGGPAGGPGRVGRLGLRSMRERAELVGGTLDVMSAPGAGTVVRAILPSSAAVLVG
ncbi:sensor histidine kinase [Dactylosporangium aurantiacum]|uniref:Sensor histidine kinase n=1 Tax=Dactylosporangium aurantiacum TaxID=35754 RepID=A0A9Q9IGF2_9ACTN|nr:sensor histidine kinase [Dactylosporangium aurantiacum]MDG6102834.1 sensor histidine kinase [Dactylosporangium aurantiacum]UWZ52924.1 sensor histidine kinase [Dactylosporangium aurantiacum]